MIIGGLGNLRGTLLGGIGPVAGAIVFFLLGETLADFGTIYLMIFGAVAILSMLRAPRGIRGLVADRFGIELFPVRRRVRFVTTDKE